MNSSFNKNVAPPPTKWRAKWIGLRLYFARVAAKCSACCGVSNRMS